ncbi:MAG: RidA family protein [Calditrichota bacterium]
MTRRIVKTDQAPDPVGPYNQAVIANGMVYTAGQIAIDPSTNQLMAGTVEEQAHQVLKNLGAVLAEAGSSFGKIVKTTIYLKSMDDFSAVNAIYGTFFSEDAPARSTVEVSRLPKDVLVEIDCIAIVD